MCGQASLYPLQGSLAGDEDYPHLVQSKQTAEGSALCLWDVKVWYGMSWLALNGHPGIVLEKKRKKQNVVGGVHILSINPCTSLPMCSPLRSGCIAHSHG